MPTTTVYHAFFSKLQQLRPQDAFRSAHRGLDDERYLLEPNRFIQQVPGPFQFHHGEYRHRHSGSEELSDQDEPARKMPAPRWLRGSVGGWIDALLLFPHQHQLRTRAGRIFNYRIHELDEYAWDSRSGR